MSEPSMSLLSITYGGLAILAISLLPLMALAMRPLSKKSYYDSILLFLMSLGVGILFATSFLFILPTAIGYDQDLEENKTNYIVKIAVYFATLLFFLNFETIFRQVVAFVIRRKREQEKQQKGSSEEEVIVVVAANTPGRKPPIARISTLAPSVISIPSTTESDASPKPLEQPLDIVRGLSESAPSSLHSSIAESFEGAEKKSVVWIILAADGIHSFVDGVAIGSAIVNNLMEGLAMALVLFIEELPHKLGDIAILLGAGIPNCRAVIFAWLAAVPCFIGYIVGVVVGKILADAIPWIYSVAAALFLYTAIVDVLPEVTRRIRGKFGMFLLDGDVINDAWYRQVDGKFIARLLLADCGFMVGFTIASILAAYEGKITLGDVSVTVTEPSYQQYPQYPPYPQYYYNRL